MSRLSATTCQDVSSLGRGVLSVCVCVRALTVCVFVLFCVSLSCQDESSFGNNLSRCIVFRQGGSECVCVYVSLDCVYICTVQCEPQLSR